MADVNTKWVHMTSCKLIAYGSREHEMSPHDFLQISYGWREHKTNPRDLLQIA